jgi:hypothetical protein
MKRAVEFLIPAAVGALHVYVRLAFYPEATSLYLKQQQLLGIEASFWTLIISN